LANPVARGIDVPNGRFPERYLELGGDLFDGFEVRGIWRQVD